MVRFSLINVSSVLFVAAEEHSYGGSGKNMEETVSTQVSKLTFMSLLCIRYSPLGVSTAKRILTSPGVVVWQPTEPQDTDEPEAPFVLAVSVKDELGNIDLGAIAESKYEDRLDPDLRQ